MARTFRPELLGLQLPDVCGRVGARVEVLLAIVVVALRVLVGQRLVEDFAHDRLMFQ